MTSLTLPAPAKLNLFLHVVGRREDGYHLLETLFHFIDFGDRITLHCLRDPVVERTAGAAGVAAGDDLTVRAARLLQARLAEPRGVSIHVDKRLPMGGGLGGGSSDAASVLLGLNHLWGLGLSLDELAALGLELGADVPVFVHGRAALGRGVGERLVPVELAPSWYLLVCPDVEVPTSAVFAADSLTRDTPPLKIGGFPWEMDTQAGLDAVFARTRNDCEPVVRDAYPGVAQALDWLGSHAPSRMTGTGACVFARFRERTEAQWAVTDAPAGLRVVLARGLNFSPLHDALEGTVGGV